MRHHIYSPFYSRRNPFSLRRSAAVMSTTPPPLRGRSSHSRHQPYSDRSQPSTTASAAVVSGESHFQSVRDVNSSLQRHRPYNNDNNNEGNQFGLLNNEPRSSPYYRNPNPNLKTNMMNQLVAKTRPPDYRIWEFAHPTPPPPNAERFVVLSYNILADYLANSHRNLYQHIPRRFMSWDWRKNNLLFELGLWSADIMCFQEVDKFDELEQGLRDRGYSGVWKMRTGDPIDGCATFWRTSRFKLVYEECIEFNKLSMRDNVAQICVLESLKENQSGKKLASSESTEKRNRVVICNIHVLYNPKRGEMKLGQVRVLLERAQAVSKNWDDAPVILCGDFNCVPKSPLYNFISGQKLDISELDRANVSGQASADLRQSPNQFGNQTRGQSTGAITSSVVVENGKKMTSENNLNTPESILENPPTIKRITQFSSESPLSFPLSDVSEKYCRDLLVASIENTSRNVSNDNMKDGGHSTESDNSTNEGTSAESGDQSDISQRIFSSESDDINMLSVAGDTNSDAVDSEAKPGLANKYVEAVEDVVEDAEAFMSELNDNKDAFPSNLGIVGDRSFTRQSELFNKPPYDPSSWTPMEIATATGDANNTVLQHSLKLSSTYTEVQDRSGTRDSNGEPLVTSYHSCFMGTVDYIWRSEGLRTVKVLAPIPKSAMLPTKGFPSKKWGSDHIALASELAFTK